MRKFEPQPAIDDETRPCLDRAPVRIIHSVMLLAAMLLVTTACSYSNNDMSNHEGKGDDATLSALEQQWGVRPISIQLTATDYMLDFRYKVVDAQKAAAIINRKTRPYLIVEKTGVRLNVPASYKIGPLRQSAQFAQPNRNYFMLFANPGRHVKAGDSVSVVAGNFKLANMRVH